MLPATGARTHDRIGVRGGHGIVALVASDVPQLAVEVLALQDLSVLCRKNRPKHVQQESIYRSESTRSLRQRAQAEAEAS
jgi:hypothetical protein